MANKFKVWVDQENINNTQTYSEFENDTQRRNGFEAGNPASAIRVNTGLRQANLVACGLMDAIAPDNQTLDHRSTREQVKTVITEGLKEVISENAKTAESITYSTTAPTEDNTETNTLKAVVLSQIPEESEIKTGYIYLITM